MIGIPVSIVFGNTETCGVCTHSIHSSCPKLFGYYAEPFVCNSLKKSDQNTLLIKGSNVASNSHNCVVDGHKWYDSGISVSIHNKRIIHRMPKTYDSNF